jgi:FtsP/CotA-like multicopper oxidase with cupredoxin domain
VNARKHPFLSIEMKESRQQVLPLPGQASYPASYFDPINQAEVLCPAVNVQPTQIWAYETSDTLTGKLLGPAHWPAVTVEATRYTPTLVQYENNLPPFNYTNQSGSAFVDGLVQGLVSIDQTNLWADPLKLSCHSRIPPVNCVLTPDDACCRPFVGPAPTVPHLHGAEVPPGFDGGPDAWFTPDGRKGPEYRTMGRPGPGKAVYQYNNSQEPGTLWFHDHNLGATRGGVYSSLAAFYLLRDESKEPKRLPADAYEIELVLQDRQFDTNSQIFFPDGSGADVATSNLNGPPTNPDIHPLWNPEFIGDVAMVNGAPWPVLKVEPRRYRFRFLDGANARVFRLGFQGVPVYQIVADASYLDAPVPVSQVFIAPGERADVIVDFTKFAGQTITLSNDAPVPFPDGLYPVPHLDVENGIPVLLPADQPQMASIMQFQVLAAATGRDLSCNPAQGQCQRPTPVLRLTDGQGNIARGVKVDKVRQLILKEHGGAGGPIEVLLNNTAYDGMVLNQPSPNLPTGGISEQPRIGSIEMWEIINLTADAHPIHTHLVQYEILNRESIDLDGTQGSNIPGGYLGYDDGVNPRIPGAWAAAYAPMLGSPLCFNIDPNPADDPFNPCPGFGPPLPYGNNGRSTTLPNGNRVAVVGGNPDITPYLLNDATPPPAEEAGLKDTAKSNPGQVMRILMRFAPTGVPLTPHKSLAGVNLYPFDPTQGQYVWHCHILDHEDNDMMRPYKVVK